MEELALGLRSMAFRKGFGNRDPRTDRIYLEVQRAMLSIPGHAEYYRDKVLKAQEQAKAKGGSSLSYYDREIMYAIQTLKHLHSPEGVRVLGDLLANDWVPPGNETAVASERFVPLSVSARVALSQFPLLNKPFKDIITQNNRADAQAAWQQWFEEIKSGKRTFRFEGDPTEYDLNGPAPKEKLERITLNRRMESDRAARHGRKDMTNAEAKETTSEEPSVRTSRTYVMIIVGLFLLGVVVWYFARTKRDHSP